MNNKAEMKINWNSLATVKSFDTGPPINEHATTEPVGHQVDVISQRIATPISLLVQSLIQQLCTLLERDKDRASELYNVICEKLHQMSLIDETYAMGEFEVMRSQYQKALYQLVSVASGIETPISFATAWPIIEPSGFEWSRYHREFEEIYFIASGGFGTVWKAKHRLDDMEYAIKKICIKSSNIKTVMNHFSEVKTLASLNHPNIVCYKAAWLEPLIESKGVEMDSEDSETDDNIEPIITSFCANQMPSFVINNPDSFPESKSSSNFTVSFEKSNSANDNSEEIVENNLSDDCKIIQVMKRNNKQMAPNRVNLKWATLYIQMSLCQKNLKEWLEERSNSISPKSNEDQMPSPILLPNDPFYKQYSEEYSPLNTILDMFTQVVNGLQYMHEKGIIHHDIKPSNIFIGEEGKTIRVQLGDFGLACPLQQSHNGIALGTQLYAAPEQLAGECDPKSDLYSLGIVLLEMMETFVTDMERVKTITALKMGQIPTHLTANYPKIAHIIGKLTQKNPARRLDTNQLLNELKSLKDNKDELIKSLREEISNKDDEIAKLRMMLANCKM